MIGIDPASIVPLSLVGGPSEACVLDKQARLCAVAADWIEDHVGTEHFSWERHWHHVPHDLLARAFTREELIRLWHDSVFMSKLGEYFEKHEPLVWKVQHALWRYGCSRDYSKFVACLNGLGRLSADLPDFDARLSHTRFINTAAWAEHGRDGSPIYLDASFGVLLHYKGAHVMTIGFAPSLHGILVAQVPHHKFIETDDKACLACARLCGCKDCSVLQRDFGKALSESGLSSCHPRST